MTTSNPYQAPSSDITQATSTETYQPKIFSRHGRIGRLRYLAYCMVAYLFLVPALIMGAFLGSSAAAGNSGSMTILSVVGIISYIALIVYYIIVAKRRFNDLNQSGWMTLLVLIPIVNIFISLWLIFGPGTKGSNKFGLAPCENPLSVKIVGFGLPVLIMILGIVAAIAIPAYQDYTIRAQNAASSFSE